MDPLKSSIAQNLTSSITSNQGLGQTPYGSSTSQDTMDTGFADKLRNAIQQTNQSQLEADKSIEQVVQGTLGIHEGMLKIGKADTSLRLLLQVRGKVMEAYREIIHMSF
jgi:flagellar hook-basal body complex protein FliE